MPKLQLLLNKIRQIGNKYIMTLSVIGLLLLICFILVSITLHYFISYAGLVSEKSNFTDPIDDTHAMYQMNNIQGFLAGTLVILLVITAATLGVAIKSHKDLNSDTQVNLMAQAEKMPTQVDPQSAQQAAQAARAAMGQIPTRKKRS